MRIPRSFLLLTPTSGSVNSGDVLGPGKVIKVANKGLIMKKENGEGIVLTSRGEFKRLPLPPEKRVGEKVALPLWRAGKLYGLAVAASLLAVVLFCQAYFSLVAQAAAYVSLDIGKTALEVGVDRQGKIVAVRAFSPSGEALKQRLALKGRRLNEALRLVLEAEGVADRPSLAGVVMAAVTETPGKEGLGLAPAAVAEAIAAAFAGEETAPKIVVAALPPEIRREALKAGLSPGRFLLWQAARKQGLSLTAEELKKESLGRVESVQRVKVEDLASREVAAMGRGGVAVLPAKKAEAPREVPPPELPGEPAQVAPPPPKTAVPGPSAAPAEKAEEPAPGPAPRVTPEKPAPPKEEAAPSPEKETQPAPEETAPVPEKEEPAPVEVTPAPTDGSSATAPADGTTPPPPAETATTPL